MGTYERDGEGERTRRINSSELTPDSGLSYNEVNREILSVLRNYLCYAVRCASLPFWFSCEIQFSGHIILSAFLSSAVNKELFIAKD